MDTKQTTKLDEIYALLRALILRDECRVDRFDASYLDDLPDILREMHGITSLSRGEEAGGESLRKLTGLLGLASGAALQDLAPALRREGVKDADFTPRRVESESLKDAYRYSEVKAWSSAKNKTVKEGADAVEAVNRFQAEYSRKDEKKILGLIKRNHDRVFDNLGRDETGDVWTPLFRRFVQEGILKADEPVLCIGPRQAGEIRYFRKEVGLKGTIGLDLFTHDPDLIKVGDMHKMPFPDSMFGLVYQRNTFDKSYDIRQALRECVRVLRPSGILVSDDCHDYTNGVDEAARTNVTRNEWFLRFLRDHVEKVHHNAETPSNVDWFGRIGQIAIQVRK